METKTIKTYDGPGKGRKQCKSCGVYSGVRTAVCVCGKSFIEATVALQTPNSNAGAVNASNTPKLHKPTDAAPKAITTSYLGSILIPSGKCPIALTATDEETVTSWANNLKVHYASKDQDLSKSAIRYFVRHFYDIHSENYRNVVAMLQ